MTPEIYVALFIDNSMLLCYGKHIRRIICKPYCMRGSFLIEGPVQCRVIRLFFYANNVTGLRFEISSSGAIWMPRPSCYTFR